MSANSCIIFDNGGDTLKFGYATSSHPRCINNCIALIKNQPRRYVGDEIDSLRNKSGLIINRTLEKGIITNWQTNMDVWERAFDILNINISSKSATTGTANKHFEDKTFVLTSAPFAPESVQNDMNEIVFEELGFSSFISRPASWFSAYEFSNVDTEHNSMSRKFPDCNLVIDSGFSFTHAIPLINMKTNVKSVRCQVHSAVTNH